MTVPDWLRTLLISVTTGLTTGLALAIASYLLTSRRERRARVVTLVQSLTEPLAFGRVALHELANAEYFGVSDGARQRVTDCYRKLGHARTMGLPLKLHRALAEAESALSGLDEGQEDESSAAEKLDGACEVVATYLRKN